MHLFAFTSIIMALSASVLATPLGEDAAIAIRVPEAADLESRQTASGCTYLYVSFLPGSLLL